MKILELLNTEIFNITSEINKYQFDIITDKSKLENLIVTDTKYEIIKTGKGIIPYLIKKSDETYYVPLDGGEIIHLFNIDVDKNSENNYYITYSIKIENINESVDYNEYGIPDKKLYKINNEAEIDKAIKNFKFCEESYKGELAKNIIQRSEDLNFKPIVSSVNEFFKYVNKEDVLENEELYDKYLNFNIVSDIDSEYDWLKDELIIPIKNTLGDLLDTDKFRKDSDLISNHIDYSKYMEGDLLSKANELDYLINAFNMNYLNRFIKSANIKLENVILAKLKLSGRFKEIFIKTNNIGDELVFGVNKNFLSLIVEKGGDIILIPLIEDNGVNKNNISALCLGEADIKMRVRKLMIKSKNVVKESLTEGIINDNSEVNFTIACESLEDYDNRIDFFEKELNGLIEVKDQEGLLEGLACVLCIHTELENYRLDKIESIQESRLCGKLIDRTRKLFRESFSESQKLKPVNFTQYCIKSDSIKTLFNDSDNLELSLTRQLRKIIL